MMSKLQKQLAILLAVQLVVAVLIYWPWNRSAAGGGSLLSGFEVDSVAAVVIENNPGGQVRLAKSAGSWTLPDSGDYPVESDKVTSFLEKLKEVNTNRLVTQTIASHDRLEVGTNTFQRRVTLEMADGKPITLYLGSASGAGATHIREGSQSKVYLTGALSSFDAGAQPSNWIDTAYLTLNAAQIQRLTLENQHGSFLFEKTPAGTWTMANLPEGETLDDTRVTSLVNQLVSLRLKAPLGTQEQPEYRLSPPQAVVGIALQDESGASTQVVVRVGAFDAGDSSYIVHASNSPYYVTVNSFSVEGLVNNTIDSFLVQPTPTPAP